MNFERLQDFVRFMELRQERTYDHPSGAKIYVAEKYANYDHEYKKPHYQTWVHVSLGEDSAIVGQKLFFDFNDLTKKEGRMLAARKRGFELIDALAPGVGHA